MDEDLKVIKDAVNTLNVTLCRLYDVGMALLTIQNEDTAAMLEQVHEEGRFVGAIPFIGENPFDE